LKSERDRRESNVKLRDENIRISEERSREIEEPEEAVDLGFSPSQIRKKLRRNHGKKEND